MNAVPVDKQVETFLQNHDIGSQCREMPLCPFGSWCNLSGFPRKRQSPRVLTEITMEVSMPFTLSSMTASRRYC